MSIFDYIDKYGKYSFEEKEFNEVDNVILSILSYLDLDGIVSRGAKVKRTLAEVGEVYFRLYSDKENNITSVRDAIDILRAIFKKKRYSNILVYNYLYIGDDSQQFSAICLEMENNVVFVSFEGTDHLISGWEEDFVMVYKFPVKAQRQAIKYVNKNFTFSSKKLIFGGHSKGGNLAMVASMYCNFMVRSRIIQIYNNDGPGLRKRQLESYNYERIGDKLIHIVPNYTVVGLLLRHKDEYKVIKSSRRSILCHQVTTWEVEDDHFKGATLSTVSKLLDEGMIKWLDNYNDEKREKFVKSLFDIFRKAEINNLLEIMDNKKLLFKLLKESNDLEDETRDMIKDFIGFLLNYFKDYSVDKIKSIF